MLIIFLLLLFIITHNSFEGGESVTLGLNFKKEKVNTINKISDVEEYIDFKLASVFRLRRKKYPHK